MTAEQLPIKVVRSSRTHTEPKERVQCPKSGKLECVTKCVSCEDLRIILRNCVKCLHNPKKANAGKPVTPVTI